jgi:hypothetical protein
LVVVPVVVRLAGARPAGHDEPVPAHRRVLPPR